jgi:hypothetical protein
VLIVVAALRYWCCSKCWTEKKVAARHKGAADAKGSLYCCCWLGLPMVAGAVDGAVTVKKLLISSTGMVKTPLLQ